METLPLIEPQKYFKKNVEQVAQDAMLISEKEYVLSLSLIQMMKL